MSNSKKSAEAFLADIGMAPRAINVQKLAGEIMMEMQKGLDGQPSSLPMLPTYLDVPSHIPVGEEVVVIDAGGTNLRVARLAFNEKGLVEIADFSRMRMPGTGGHDIPAQEFFQNMAQAVYPLLNSAAAKNARGHTGLTPIGFCFSYALEMSEDGDGRLMHWTKEIQAAEVVGMKIAEPLKNAILALGWKNKLDITLLNDSAATLLCGASGGRKWSGHAGFILGTGTNASYVESNTRIGKIKNMHGQQVINCELGSFRMPLIGEGDKRLHARTEDAQAHWLEKMISGRYFGPLVAEVLILASERNGGPFSPKTAQALSRLVSREEITTKDMNGYCYNPHNADNKLVRVMKSTGNDLDAQCLWFLIDFLAERGTKIVAAQMAAILLKGRGLSDTQSAAPKNNSTPVRPICICADGTTFYRFYRFSERVDNHLRPLMADYGIFYEVIKAEDAPITGAAAAALGRVGTS